MIFWGDHLIRHWSTTQSVVALSSGEAELVGIVKGSAQGLGAQSLAADLGFEISVDVYSDASAAVGICRRRGLGKVRHIAVADLWVQERLKTGDFALHKISGKENPADMLTKYLDAPTLQHLLELAWLEKEQGRAALAPELTHCVVHLAVRSLWRIRHGKISHEHQPPRRDDPVR